MKKITDIELAEKGYGLLLENLSEEQERDFYKKFISLSIEYPDLVDKKTGVHSQNPKLNEEAIKELKKYYHYSFDRCVFTPCLLTLQE